MFREKRFVFADNLETECIEDKCSRRELEECFDFETGLVKVDFGDSDVGDIVMLLTL